MDRSNLLAALMMILAMAGFAVEDAVIKHLSATMPVGQVVMIICAAGAVAFAVIARRAGLSLWRPEALRGAVLLRNLSEMIGGGTFVLAIALAPLSVVTAILQTMPLAVTLGAALFLAEPVGWRRWVAIAVGFAGMLIILRPGTADFDPAAALAVVTVLALSVRDLAIRRVPPAVHSLQLAGWGMLAAIPSGAILILLVGQAPVLPTAPDWGLLALASLCGVGGYGALVLATRSGDVAVTTPLRYTRLVFAMAIGVLVFGERPDAATLLGSVLIVGAGLYTLTREMRLRRTPSAVPPSAVPPAAPPSAGGPRPL